MMNRRTLIPLLGSAVLGAPLQVRGQQPGRTYRIGCLYPSPREAFLIFLICHPKKGRQTSAGLRSLPGPPDGVHPVSGRATARAAASLASSNLRKLRSASRNSPP